MTLLFEGRAHSTNPTLSYNDGKPIKLETGGIRSPLGIDG